MEKDEYKLLLNRLIKHFNHCYDEYMQEVLALDKKQIVESASEITAVKETHVEMCFRLLLSMYTADRFNSLIIKSMDEQEAACLLALENPLKALAMKWWFHTLGNKVDFNAFYRSQKSPEGSRESEG